MDFHYYLSKINFLFYSAVMTHKTKKTKCKKISRHFYILWFALYVIYWQYCSNVWGPVGFFFKEFILLFSKDAFKVGLGRYEFLTVW